MSSASSKRDRVTGPRKKNRRTLSIIAALAVLGILSAAFFMTRNPGSSPAPTSVAELFPAPSGGTASPSAARPAGTATGRLEFDVSEFTDGTARYYRHQVQGKEVSFFILRSSDGVIRAAFDACDVCFQAKRGYRQQGDLMVCNNCGQVFPSVRINEEKGGCNPAPLQRIVEGERVIIEVASLSEGLYLF